jgi:hypothetical protein
MANVKSAPLALFAAISIRRSKRDFARRRLRRVRPLIHRRGLARAIGHVAIARNLPTSEFSSVGLQAKAKSTRRKGSQIGVSRSKRFAYGNRGVHPVFDDTRDSARIRLAKNFD